VELGYEQIRSGKVEVEFSRAESIPVAAFESYEGDPDADGDTDAGTEKAGTGKTGTDKTDPRNNAEEA
jgi:hypothetical protein